MFTIVLCCISVLLYVALFFFFKQKTAYEMRISDWSSDVCSSDLLHVAGRSGAAFLCVFPGLHGRHAWVGDFRQPDPDGVLLGADQPVLIPADRLLAPPRRCPARCLHGLDGDRRSDERRVGKEVVSTCRSRCSPSPAQHKHYTAYAGHSHLNT